VNAESEDVQEDSFTDESGTEAQPAAEDTDVTGSGRTLRAPSIEVSSDVVSRFVKRCSDKYRRANPVEDRVTAVQDRATTGENRAILSLWPSKDTPLFKPEEETPESLGTEELRYAAPNTAAASSAGNRKRGFEPNDVVL
jgi:hypothetical protein